MGKWTRHPPSPPPPPMARSSSSETRVVGGGRDGGQIYGSLPLDSQPGGIESPILKNEINYTSCYFHVSAVRLYKSKVFDFPS